MKLIVLIISVLLFVVQGCAAMDQPDHETSSINRVVNETSAMKIASVFSNNMVIQQQRVVKFWGEDTPKQKVTVVTSWGSKSSSITNENGKWEVSLNTPAADFKPHSIDVIGSATKTLKNILLGEVWFASGQSNMGMPLSGKLNQPVNGSNETILNSTNNQLRLFDTKQNLSDTPLNNVTGTWEEAAPGTVKNFSATAYFFASRLQKLLNVPVGIIHSSWGGTPVEAWMDKSTLAKYPDYKFWNALEKTNTFKQPSKLFNAMINPFLGLQIKGAIWYQGEANRPRAQEYQTLFSSMVESWREQWDSGVFPFYYVQIAPFGKKPTGAPYLREAQLQAMGSIPNSGMAVTLDIGECNLIHPAEKRTVGERLAYWALAKQYDFDIAYDSPKFSKLAFNQSGKVNVVFDNAPRGITSFGKPITQFEVAGDDHKFYSANAKISFRKPEVSLWSDSVKHPKFVRYAFKECPTGELFSVEGIPVSSFRTDSFPATRH